MSAHPAPRATRSIRAETAGSSGLALGPNQRGKGGGEVEASIPVMAMAHQRTRGRVRRQAWRNLAATPRSDAGATTHVEDVQACRFRTEQLRNHRTRIGRPAPVVALGLLVEQLGTFLGQTSHRHPGIMADDCHHRLGDEDLAGALDAMQALHIVDCRPRRTLAHGAEPVRPSCIARVLVVLNANGWLRLSPA